MTAAVDIFIIIVVYLQADAWENFYSNSIFNENQTQMSKIERKGRNYLNPSELPNFIFTNIDVARNFDLLTTEKKRRRQQHVLLTKNSRTVLKERNEFVPKRKVRECVRCCKQWVHKYKVNPRIVYHECWPCDKDSVSSNIPGHSQDRCADNFSSVVSKDLAAKQTEAFKLNVSIPSPNEVRRSGTVDCSI